MVHIELPLRSITARKSFLKAACEFEEVAAVVELGAEAQFELRLITRDTYHLDNFFERFSGKFQHPFRILRFLTTTEIEYSGPFGSGGSPLAKAPLRLAAVRNPSETKKIDEVDHSILSALANESYLNIEQIARHLRMPRTTLQYRISTLESSGIIMGHFYLVDPKAFNDSPVCLQVRSRCLRELEKLELKKFAFRHPRVAWIGFFLGEQSAEIYTLVQSFEEAQAVIADLGSQFKDVIDSVHLIPQLSFFKYSTYPYLSYRTLAGTK